MAKIYSLNFLIFLAFITIEYSYGQNTIDDLLNEKPKIYNKAKMPNTFYYKAKDKKSPIYGLEICYTLIPIDNVNLSIEKIDKSIYQKDFHSQYLSDLVIFNGGFWGYNKENKKIPLGLVRSKNKTSSKYIKWKTGGFLFVDKQGHVKLFPVKDISQLSSATTILQSKPLIVERSKNGIYVEDGSKANRVVVGITKNKNFIVFGIFDKDNVGATLHELGEILSKKLKVETAICMDGGPGSFMYLPLYNLFFGNESLKYTPNSIRILSKKI